MYVPPTQWFGSGPQLFCYDQLVVIITHTFPGAFFRLCPHKLRKKGTLRNSNEEDVVRRSLLFFFKLMIGKNIWCRFFVEGHVCERRTTTTFGLDFFSKMQALVCIYIDLQNEQITHKVDTPYAFWYSSFVHYFNTLLAKQPRWLGERKVREKKTHQGGQFFQ